MTIPAPLSPDAWMIHVFSAKAAREGGIVRRKLRDIEKYVGRNAFETELARRGYHAIENAGQMVIFAIKNRYALFSKRFF